jgi:hypothetical protein
MLVLGNIQRTIREPHCANLMHSDLALLIQHYPALKHLPLVVFIEGDDIGNCSGLHISARRLANSLSERLTFRDTIRVCGLTIPAHGLTLCAHSSQTSA